MVLMWCRGMGLGVLWGWSEGLVVQGGGGAETGGGGEGEEVLL